MSDADLHAVCTELDRGAVLLISRQTAADEMPFCTGTWAATLRLAPGQSARIADAGRVVRASAGSLCISMAKLNGAWTTNPFASPSFHMTCDRCNFSRSIDAPRYMMYDGDRARLAEAAAKIDRVQRVPSPLACVLDVPAFVCIAPDGLYRSCGCAPSVVLPWQQPDVFAEFPRDVRAALDE